MFSNKLLKVQINNYFIKMFAEKCLPCRVETFHSFSSYFCKEIVFLWLLLLWHGKIFCNIYLLLFSQLWFSPGYNYAEREEDVVLLGGALTTFYFYWTEHCEKKIITTIISEKIEISSNKLSFPKKIC